MAPQFFLLNSSFNIFVAPHLNSSFRSDRNPIALSSATSVRRFWRSVNTRAVGVCTLGMDRNFKPGRFAVLRGLGVVVGWGVVVFVIEGGGHGRTAEVWVAAAYVGSGV